MITFKPALAEAVKQRKKTVTRRLVAPGDKMKAGGVVVTASGRVRWRVGQKHAVCPGNGDGTVKKAVCQVHIEEIERQKLSKITAEDVEAEGVGIFPIYAALVKKDPILAWIMLWNSINKKVGTRWEDDPEVWVIRFRVVD